MTISNQKLHFNRLFKVIPGLFCGLAISTNACDVNAQFPTAGSDQGAAGSSDHDQADGVEYLTRGPLHEAFASPYQSNPEAQEVVPHQPPEPIDELPPEYIPEGENVVWIPGNWSFDDERNDFIWISGVWRDLPPGRMWVPGYWDNVEGGYRYVSGFWADNQVADVEYLPLPPATLEQGPSSPSPGENYFYIPGNWVYSQTQYLWKPGNWFQSQTDWIWTPSQYVWTPRGCVYQDGYWDYDMNRRGVVFSPVYYQQPVYRNASYRYRPQYAISTGLGLFVNLFLNPRQGRYYYGNYYGNQYSNRYYSWATRFQDSQHYDPFYVNYRQRSQHGGNQFGGNQFGRNHVRGNQIGGNQVNGNQNLLVWITNQHQTFVKNEVLRPAATVNAQRAQLISARAANLDPTTLRLSSMGESLDDMASDNDTGLKFRTLGRNALEEISKAAQPLKNMRRNRMETESTVATAKLGESAKSRGDSQVAGNDQGKRIDRDAQANAKAGVKSPPDGVASVDAKMKTQDKVTATGDQPRGRLKLDAIAAAAKSSSPANSDDQNSANSKKNSNSPKELNSQKTAGNRTNATADSKSKSADGTAGADKSANANANASARGNATSSMRPPRPKDWPLGMAPERKDVNAVPDRPNTTGGLNDAKNEQPKANAPGGDKPAKRQPGATNALGQDRKQAKGDSQVPNNGLNPQPNLEKNLNRLDKPGAGAGAANPGNPGVDNPARRQTNATDTPGKNPNRANVDQAKGDSQVPNKGMNPRPNLESDPDRLGNPSDRSLPVNRTAPQAKKPTAPAGNPAPKVGAGAGAANPGNPGVDNPARRQPNATNTPGKNPNRANVDQAKGDSQVPNKGMNPRPNLESDPDRRGNPSDRGLPANPTAPEAKKPTAPAANHAPKAGAGSGAGNVPGVNNPTQRQPNATSNPGQNPKRANGDQAKGNSQVPNKGANPRPNLESNPNRLGNPSNRNLPVNPTAPQAKKPTAPAANPAPKAGAGTGAAKPAKAAPGAGKSVPKAAEADAKKAAEADAKKAADGGK